MERGWSQEKFADICGVHRTYMGHIERGEKNVSFNTLVRLAEALGITLPELLTEVPEGKKRPSKNTSKRRYPISADDMGGMVRALNMQRKSLDQTARVLKDVEDALKSRKQR